MKVRHYLLGLILFVLSATDTFALDRWRILALRISFPQEIPDNPTTSGDGAFDLRDPARARPDYRFLYDTPPHDRTYFEAHLQALASYYGAVSDGQVEITFEVWPKGLSDSYRLSRPLLSYGNGRTQEEVAARITELFRDGISAADSAEGGQLDFSAYRAYVVFHAGIGAEARSGRAFNDVPSAFVSEQDLLRYVKGSIPVKGGRVQNGMLLPEAISTDGRGGLNGTLARFFGSQLGLPGLSNFKDDLPAAGGWSLMDVGSNRIVPREIAERLPGFVRDATGLIGFAPVLPEAWSRVRLGWLSPLVVTRDTTLQVAAADAVTQRIDNSLPLPRAVKVPITSDEYFLLENRESRLKPGEVPKVVFSRGDSGGVWLRRDHIDAFIPGSGILIWHVDESVIREAGEGRGVNDDPHRRGVRLVEADGYSDIGNIFVPFDRVDQIEGGPDDPFYVGGKAVAFGPTTRPATKSNAGYDTGIRILVKSPAQDTMTVSISFDRTGGRWPVTGLPAFGGNAARALDLDGDGSKEVVAETPDGRLYAYRANGRPYGPEGLWTVSGDSSAFTPAVGDLDGDGSEDLVTAGASGLVSARSGQKGLLWSVRLSSRPSTPPTVVDLGAGPLILLGGASGDLIALNGRDGKTTGPNGPVTNVSIAGLGVGDIDGDKKHEVIVVASDGGLYAVQGDQRRRIGGAPGRVSRPPAVGDLDRDGKAEVAVVSDDGAMVLIKDGTVVRTSASGIRSAPVIADVDGDGFSEVVAGGAGLYIFRHNGIAQTGTPFTLPARDRAPAVEAPPLAADLDGDGKLDLLFTAGDYIYGVRGDGSPLPGFPVVAVGHVVASPLLDDLDGDGGLELLALTASGTFSRWDLRGIDGSLKGKQVVWGQAGGGPGNRNAALVAAQTPGPPPLDALLPAGRVYCYPNPVEGTSARLRFYLGREARVEVKVFNAAADLVETMTLANAVPRAENEMAWDTSGYATGLYVCRVEAVGGDGRREVRFVKVAIKK